ncbi:MAG TPA: DUF2975 domain-containing protein [Rhizomicrobium sp.]|jgi:hypothetical protein
MAVSSRLGSISRVMAVLSAIGAAIQPVALTYIFLDPGHSKWLMFDVENVGDALNAGIPLANRLMALGCALFAEAFTVWALWSLCRLFLLYARGEVFTRGALRQLNHVALALVGGVIAGFVMRVPMTAALSWPLGHGHRYISLSFGTGDVATLFMAGVVLVIVRVMAQASALADENAKFV